MVEQMLRDFYSSEAGWRIASLRYFNPAGAYPGGALGMIPGSDAGNLMSRICSVAQGVSPYLSIYGGDYLTADGTGVRDYIHVQDLADAHLSALNYLGQTPADKCVEINVGTGFGTTVLELLRGFESVTGKQIPYRITGRRAGDVGVCYADVRRAEQLLGWKSKRPLEEICKDTWFYAPRTPELSLGN